MDCAKIGIIAQKYSMSQKCCCSKADCYKNREFLLNYKCGGDILYRKCDLSAHGKFVYIGVCEMEVSYKKLWKLLIDKDMKKKDLQSSAGVSWASITKMSKGEPVGMEVLMKVCGALECNIGDVVDLIPEEATKE